MTNPHLWRALGFLSAAAFRQEKARGTVGVRIFKIPHRRGSFAFTQEVEQWIANLEKENEM